MKKYQLIGVKEALQQYRDILKEKYYVEISDNALHRKEPMYQDNKDGSAKQIGYVITGKTEFQRDNGSWSAQYIDLWVEIKTITKTEF